MTPGARVAAAIEILDQVLDGASGEQVLTSWARGHRFAGSKDRAAIRDHVFDALRCLRSHAARGGARTGRGIMIGACRAADIDPGTLFTGEGYAASALTNDEKSFNANELSDAVALDMPDWVMAPLQASLGQDTQAVCEALRHRAPVFLRVNTALTTVARAQEALAVEGIATQAHPLTKTALEVTENPRRIQSSAAFRDGEVELQDAASQAILETLKITPGQSVLDYCAGGGGKALALAARGAKVTAHDVNAARMRDLPERATRAAVHIELASRAQLAASYDLVLADAPCSGSGAWRRSPQGKWDLTAERLAELCAIQAEILDDIKDLVAPGGVLAYATCSLFEAENQAQIAAFVARNPGWSVLRQTCLTPLDGGDGFFLAALTRESAPA